MPKNVAHRVSMIAQNLRIFHTDIFFANFFAISFARFSQFVLSNLRKTYIFTQNILLQIDQN